MKFKEFSDPLEENYDITSSLEENVTTNVHNNDNKDSEIYIELMELIGLPEDSELEQYGINKEEYLHPTIDTLRKIKSAIKNNSKGRHI